MTDQTTTVPDFDVQRKGFEGWDYKALANLAGGLDKEHEDDVVEVTMTRRQLSFIALGLSGAAGTAHTMGLEVLAPFFLQEANRAYYNIVF